MPYNSGGGERYATLDQLSSSPEIKPPYDDWSRQRGKQLTEDRRRRRTQLNEDQRRIQVQLEDIQELRVKQKELTILNAELESLREAKNVQQRELDKLKACKTETSWIKRLFNIGEKDQKLPNNTENLASNVVPTTNDNEKNMCQICQDIEVNAAFTCGHTCCHNCGQQAFERTPECPFCRKTAIRLIKLYNS